MAEPPWRLLPDVDPTLVDAKLKFPPPPPPMLEPLMAANEGLPEAAERGDPKVAPRLGPEPPPVAVSLSPLVFPFPRGDPFTDMKQYGEEAPLSSPRLRLLRKKE